MTEHVQVTGPPRVPGSPETRPERRRRAWSTAILVLVLAASLAVFAALLVLGAVDLSAGAAGGCGGG